MKSWKRALGLLLALMMCASLLPGFTLTASAVYIETPAPDAKMTVTVSDKGVLATAKDGKTAMLDQPFTAKDIDENGEITVDEALIAAHKKYNAASGYQVTDYGTYSAVTRVWGVDTYNTLFAVNHVGLTAGVTTDTVKDGDHLSVSINKDNTYYADWYTYFTENKKEVAVGETFDLTLIGHLGMAYLPEDLEDTPISGVKIGTWNKGAFTPIKKAVTDEDGKVTLTFDKAGTYVVTADGTVEDEVTVDWITYATDVVDCPIIAPGCVVTVTAPTKAPDAKMTVTVSNKGALATAKDGKTAMLNQPFTAKDIDKNGEITVDEALIAAHKKYNAASGYQVTDYGTYSAVTRVWGVDTYNTLFAVNHVGILSGVLADTVKNGDSLSVSINKDNTYYADWYTYFTEGEIEVAAGEPVGLTLMGHLGMAYLPEDLEDTPISGVQVGTWNKGAFTPIKKAVTDEDGKVTLTFDKAGTYVVTADGTVEDEVTVDWITYATDVVDCPIIAPGCVVTVTAPREVQEGKSLTLPAMIVDGKDVTKKAEWSTSDKSIATVTNGKVTAKKKGTVTITATYEGETVTFKVTVTKAESTANNSSSLNKPKNSIRLGIGKKIALVNGNTVENDVAPFIENDRTMLPIRFIAETLGAKVEWFEATRQVRIEKGNTVILLTIDLDTAYVKDVPQVLDSPAIIKNDRTFLPIRFVAENLGATVTWDEAAREVSITY